MSLSKSSGITCIIKLLNEGSHQLFPLLHVHPHL
jgi:hypothetical protein